MIKNLCIKIYPYTFIALQISGSSAHRPLGNVALLVPCPHLFSACALKSHQAGEYITQAWLRIPGLLLQSQGIEITWTPLSRYGGKSTETAVGSLEMETSVFC